MLKKCKKCHREFKASSEEMDLCARCLNDEFAPADVIKDEDLAEFSQEARINTRRQMARVGRMNIGYNTNNVFNSSGRLHFIFGLLLFVFCAGIFFIGDSETVQTPINQLPQDVQVIFSVTLCVIAAGLLLFSFRRHKTLVSAICLGMVGFGYFMPHFWHYRGAAPVVAAPTAEETQETAPADEPPVYVPLTDEELSPVYEVPKSISRKTYGIYVDSNNPKVRTVLAEVFKRMFIANEVRYYPCRDGYLFVVVNVQNKDSRIAERVLGRVGTIVHSRRGSNIADQDPRTLVFEVHCHAAFLEDLLDEGVSKRPDVDDWQSGNFIALNLEELDHLDVKRVGKAALRLKEHPSSSFQRDVCKKLLDVLNGQPWSSCMGVYTNLVEALVVYGELVGDEDASLQDQITETALSYFKTCCMTQDAAHRHVPEAVLNYLVQRVPELLVDPVFEQWSKNPVDWSAEVAVLGSLMEPRVLELLHETDISDITRINDILAYLKRYGTQRAVPELQRFTNHEDQIIQQTAREIISSHS